jgi:hypothetical protein
MNIGRMGVPFLLGLTPYLYLPLRAAQGPALNWGNPVSLERLLWHVTGSQYRVWIFSSTEAAGRQLNYFLSTLPGETGYVGLILGLLGLLVLWRRERRVAVTTLLLFAATVLYSINYDIHDIDSYFLLAHIVMVLWAAIGLVVIAEWAVKQRGLTAHTIAAVVLLVGAVPCAIHFGRSDESGNHLVEDYTHNLLGGLAPKALVFSFQWDYWVSPSYYYQRVRGFRSDVAVVDKELLRRSWYFRQLERQHPWLISRSAVEVEAFLSELEKFEHEKPYNPAAIQARYVEMIRSFVARSMVDRPVYVTGEIEPEFTHGLQRVPEGLAFRIYADTLFHPSPVPEVVYRPFPRRGRLEDMVRTLYAQAYAARGTYYLNAGRLLDAEIALKMALFFDPAFPDAHRLLRLAAP